MASVNMRDHTFNMRGFGKRGQSLSRFTRHFLQIVQGHLFIYCHFRFNTYIDSKYLILLRYHCISLETRMLAN